MPHQLVLLGYVSQPPHNLPVHRHPLSISGSSPLCPPTSIVPKENPAGPPMASNPTVRLSVAASALPRVLSHSASFPIRAPLSSDDNGSDADTLTSDIDEEDDGFETASDFDKASLSPPRVASMPVAHLTTADDDGASEEEVFEDGLSDGSDFSDGEVYDPSPEGSEDGVLDGIGTPGEVDGVEETPLSGSSPSHNR